MSPVLDSTSRSQTVEMSDGSLSPPEQKVSAPFLGSQETETKQMETTPETILCCGCCACCACCAAGLLCCLKPLIRRWGALSVVFNLLVVVIVVIVVIVIIVIVIPILFAIPDPCPVNWVRHLQKCYSFSEREADWTSSQIHCSTLGASLAVIDTQQEMDFMRRYGGPAGYWIGLHREPGQPWKWTSGTEFNDLFQVAGGERCAFMDDNSISSTRCSNKQRWICSK